MAKKKDIVKNIKPAEISKVINSVNKAQHDISASLYGFNKDISDNNNIDFMSIKSKLSAINDKYKETTGENVIEFFTKLAIEENRRNSKTINARDYNRVSKTMSEIFNSPNNNFMSQIYVEEKERLNKYLEFETICRLIPQLNQIMEIITDSIISPDDFSKQIFTFKYNNTTTSSVHSEKNIFDNLRTIEKRYKIEPKAKKIIKETLICGDQFYTNIPLKREFEKMLQESYDPFLNENSYVLNESDIILSEYEINELNKYADKKEDEVINWEEDICKVVNDNIEIITKPLSLYKDELNIIKDYYSHNEATETITQSFTTTDMSTNGLFLSGRGSNLSKKNIEKLDIDGSYVRKLDPSKTVKLNIGNTCFGYYYIENDTIENILKPVDHNNNLSRIVLGNNIDLAVDSIERRDPKTLLISNIVTRTISKKLDKAFLEKNKEFKKIIYELVKDDYITNKKVRIVYFAPDEVTHFRINEKEDGYGTSLLEPILFTSKLYLATLTTTLMLKLTRSADHRTFYIETGVSKDVEEVVQSVIRDVKSKDISLSDLSSIDTIFNNIGQFHDSFIPQENGEKAIDLEITSGQEVQLENDLLEFLLKTMISAMGVPANLLQMGEEVEFSRSLAMQNGKFLRFVVTTQKEFSDPFTSMYSLLYMNEFSNNDESFNSDKLEVMLPSPSTLNFTNIADQINTAQGIVDFIVSTLVGDGGGDATKEMAVRKYVVKQYVTSVDWSSLEKDLDVYLSLAVEDKLKNNSSEEGTEEDY